MEQCRYVINEKKFYLSICGFARRCDMATSFFLLGRVEGGGYFFSKSIKKLLQTKITEQSVILFTFLQPFFCLSV